MSVAKYLIGFVVLLPVVSFSQASECKYPDPVPYCIFPSAKTLSTLAGRVSDAKGFNIPDSCVTVFAKDRKQVGSVKTDDKGFFSIKNIPDGAYVFVVSQLGFTPAIAPIRINKRSGISKKFKITMIPAGIDTCSIIKT